MAKKVTHAKEEVIEQEAMQQEAPIVEALEYSNVLKGYADSAQNIGQIVWVDNIGDASNKINVVRVLSDGTKQLFSITVSEESELTMQK